MISTDDYFGGLTEKEYVEETEKHFEFLDHISKCDDTNAYYLLNKFKDNLFAIEFVNDKEAEMLYHTFLSWKEKSDMYNDLCD